MDYELVERERTGGGKPSYSTSTPSALGTLLWNIGTRDVNKARHTEPAYANIVVFVSMLPSTSLDGAIGSLLYLPEI